MLNFQCYHFSFLILHFSLVTTSPHAHARSTRSQRCTSCTSSAPNPDARAGQAHSAYIGIPFSTAPDAQSSLASYPSNVSPPYSHAAAVERAYPYCFNAFQPFCLSDGSLCAPHANGGNNGPSTHENGRYGWVPADDTAHAPPHAPRTTRAAEADK